MQEFIDDLVVRARHGFDALVAGVRSLQLQERGRTVFQHGRIALPRVAQPALDRIGKLLRRSFDAVRGELAGPVHRVHAIRWRLRSTRLGRSADGLLVLPLLGLALVLGVFAATAGTNASPPSADSPSAPPPGSSSDETSPEVVTETIKRDGETVRIVRYKTKPGRMTTETVRRRSSVTLPRESVTTPGGTTTVHHTKTKTVTVTDVVTTTEQSTTTEYVTTTILAEPPPDGD